MGEATLGLQGSDTLLITDLILGGQGYSGRFTFDGVDTLNLASYWQSLTPKTADVMVAELEDEVDELEDDVDDLEAALSDAKADAAEAIAAAEANHADAIADLKSDVAAAKADARRARAFADRVSAQAAEGGPAGPRLVVDPAKIDLDRAEMQLAGPDSIYVTNIYYGSTRASVLLRYNGTNGAKIYGPYFDDEKLLYDSYELGEATLRVQGRDTLLLTDLVLGGQGYSGRFTFDGVDTLNLASYWQTAPPVTDEMRVADLQKQLQNTKDRYERAISVAEANYENEISDLEASLAVAEADLSRAQADAAAAVSAEPSVAPSALPTRTVLSGFGRGSGVKGDWSATNAGATQRNGGEYFAKYAIPLVQNQAQTLYTFTAKATGPGYTGYGLHFYVSGDRAAGGYGLGSSYLVWLTRDPDFYGTDDTYLQLYQSFNDVYMIQIASVKIPNAISATNTTSVLYDKSAGSVVVSVGGRRQLIHEVSTPLLRGTKIALRALGAPVQFTNLNVKAK